MILRRALVGTAVLFGLSVWSWARSDDTQAHAAPPSEARAASPDSNHDEALHRYQTNQSRHWRHVMVGGK